jgi:hypothetical protein
MSLSRKGSVKVGWGDELMAMGQAERMHSQRPEYPVVIHDKRDRPRWSDVWQGHPSVVHPSDRRKVHAQKLVNGEGCRPYIAYPFTASRGITFTSWRARDYVGTLYLTDDEKAFGQSIRSQIGPFYVLEPGVKSTTTPNKSWGVGRFSELVSEMRGTTFLRVSFDEPRGFEGAHNLTVTSFRMACAVIAASDGYVGTEGGYHHAAAVLLKPGVVIFGGFISPETTGYPWHTNLADTGPGSPCGKWRPCEHCARAMERITVEQVVTAVRALAGQTEAACQ